MKVVVAVVVVVVVVVECAKTFATQSRSIRFPLASFLLDDNEIITNRRNSL